MKEKPKWLTNEAFLKSFEDVPRFAVNLVITNRMGDVLLTKRNIPPGEGMWHIPGGFLLKNESLTEAKKRIAKKEFNLDLEGRDPYLKGVFEDLEGDERGHIIDSVFGLRVEDDEIDKIEVTEENGEVRFFSKLPKNVGFNHRDTLHRLGYEDE